MLVLKVILVFTNHLMDIYNFQVYIIKVQYHNLRDHASINWSAADSGNAITKFCQCLYIKPKCNLLKRWNVKPFRVSFFIANMAKKLKELILSRDIPTYMYFFWAREWKLCNDGPRMKTDCLTVCHYVHPIPLPNSSFQHAWRW